MNSDLLINKVLRWTIFLLGVFLLSICYNMFMLPNNLVVTGMSGLSLVFKEIFSWNPQIFIYASTFVLLIVSFIFIGKKETMHTVAGSILYPLSVSFTAPLSKMLLTYFDVSEFLIVVLLTALVYGFSTGLVYKMGFSTGGGDVIMQLLHKYCNMSTSTANFVYSFVIIVLSGLVFGVSAFIYALIVLVVSGIIVDKIQNGISTNKMFIISTSKPLVIKKMIKNEFLSGNTSLVKKNKNDREIILTIIHERNYYQLKKRILELDPSSYIVMSDCYDVEGFEVKRILDDL